MLPPMKIIIFEFFCLKQNIFYLFFPYQGYLSRHIEKIWYRLMSIVYEKTEKDDLFQISVSEYRSNNTINMLATFFAKILFCFGLAYLFVAEFVSDDLRGHPRHRPGEAHLYKGKYRRKFTFSLRPALNKKTPSLLAAIFVFFLP